MDSHKGNVWVEDLAFAQNFNPQMDMRAFWKEQEKIRRKDLSIAETRLSDRAFSNVIENRQ